MLALKNPHPRDKHIQFDPVPHIYTILTDPHNAYTSVTTWNHSHFQAFDADTIITKLKKNPKSPYFQQTPVEIKEQWDKNRDSAAQLGTQLHYVIECYYNEHEQQAATNNTDPIAYNHFLNFVKDMTQQQDGVVPYRTEWMIYDESTKLAGSIDMLFKLPDGSLHIYDWKRAKAITKTTAYNQYALTECISHLPDTNYWHYALQLNTYKSILERCYGERISGMFLIGLHPNQPNYQRFSVPVLADEMDALIEFRKSKLN